MAALGLSLFQNLDFRDIIFGFTKAIGWDPFMLLVIDIHLFPKGTVDAPGNPVVPDAEEKLLRD